MARVSRHVVTSFTEDGYVRYGASFVSSFLEFWPKDVALTVYYEGENFPISPRIDWVPISEVQHLDDFMSRLAFPLMTGHVGGGRYDIDYDARMGRKAFIQMHAMRRFGGKVFWIDADVVTFAPVPDDLLDRCLPDTKFNCHLGRDGWFYTESGFIGFNAAHPIAEDFARRYLNTFLSGVVFTLRGWHDCYVFDAVRQSFGNPEPFVDLAAGLPRGTMHPFVNSELGRYMDHRKGPRKESRSGADDLVVTRTEPYWTRDG